MPPSETEPTENAPVTNKIVSKTPKSLRQKPDVKKLNLDSQPPSEDEAPNFSQKVMLFSQSYLIFEEGCTTNGIDERIE